MGHFSQLNDDAAELLSGGKSTASTSYGGSNFGQYKKSGGTTLGNPAQAGFTPNKAK